MYSLTQRSRKREERPKFKKMISSYLHKKLGIVSCFGAWDIFTRTKLGVGKASV